MNNAHLSLFSGIGGLDLAAEWAGGFRTVAFVERDPYCQRVLARHWPGVPIIGDVREVTADAIGGVCGGWAVESKRGQEGRATADGMGEGLGLLTGGFPCQPHSVAGSRKASADERDLWGECARVTALFRPRYCVFENVFGLLSSENGKFFARVLGDLAALGYRVGWGVWGASDVGGLHRRSRVFIVARRTDVEDSDRRRGRGEDRNIGDEGRGASEARAAGLSDATGRASGAAIGDAWATGSDVADAERERGRSGNPGREDAEDARQSPGNPLDGGGLAQPCVGGSLDGIPGWMDGGERMIAAWQDGSWEDGIPRVAVGVKNRVARLRALGNAVVPQQAYPIFRAIAEIEGLHD